MRHGEWARENIPTKLVMKLGLEARESSVSPSVACIAPWGAHGGFKRHMEAI